MFESKMFVLNVLSCKPVEFFAPPLQAPAAEKLPVLYLVDSIVKNVGGEYLAVFAKNLVASFICVFEKVKTYPTLTLNPALTVFEKVHSL